MEALEIVRCCILSQKDHIIITNPHLLHVHTHGHMIVVGVLPETILLEIKFYRLMNDH